MADRSCDGCQAELGDLIRVSCAVCDDYDLCIDCFCHGFESKKHKNTHSFRLLDRFSFPIISPEWGGEEELLLIEGLEMFGIGNWEDISNHVVSKTADECHEHYTKFYLESSNYPLPEKRRLDLNELDAVKKRRRLNPSRFYNIILLPIYLTWPADRRNVNVLPPLKVKVAPSHPANHEIQGYMPGRLEFEHEAENEAEQWVKDMIFNEDDGPIGTDLKLAILSIYNSKLDLRDERKKFIFDRGLIDFRKATERKKAKEEKDFLQLTRPFARLMNACDYDSFVETSLAETQLRERIAQLQEYRRYGITTFKAAEEFEAEKKQRLASVILRSPFAVTSERVFKQITAANGLQHVISPTTQKTSTLAGKQHVISDISGIESAEFLTDRERRLCVSHQILPRAYLSIKRAILKGGNRVSRAQSQLKTGKVARIIRFIKSESRDIH